MWFFFLDWMLNAKVCVFDLVQTTSLKTWTRSNAQTLLWAWLGSIIWNKIWRKKQLIYWINKIKSRDFPFIIMPRKKFFCHVVGWGAIRHHVELQPGYHLLSFAFCSILPSRPTIVLWGEIHKGLWRLIHPLTTSLTLLSCLDWCQGVTDEKPQILPTFCLPSTC